jgi:hypothetical protein
VKLELVQSLLPARLRRVVNIGAGFNEAFQTRKIRIGQPVDRQGCHLRLYELSQVVNLGRLEALVVEVVAQ